jgi:hypothetical protein
MKSATHNTTVTSTATKCRTLELHVYTRGDTVILIKMSYPYGSKIRNRNVEMVKVKLMIYVAVVFLIPNLDQEEEFRICRAEL